MQVSITSTGPLAKALRAAGFRATQGRVALLTALQKAKKPLSPEQVAKEVKGKLDFTNAYRALEAFTKAGIVKRVDFGHTHAHYEFAEGEHHHHVVCESCGKVEDVELKESALEQAALSATPSFKTVRTHALEFFGTCRACVA